MHVYSLCANLKLETILILWRCILMLPLAHITLKWKPQKGEIRSMCIIHTQTKNTNIFNFTWVCSYASFGTYNTLMITPERHVQMTEYSLLAKRKLVTFWILCSVSWTNFSLQDKPWAEFLTLEVTACSILCTYGPVLQNNLT